MVKYILCNKRNSFGCEIRSFSVDIRDLLVVDVRFHIHSLDVINSEGKHVFVIDGVHNCICMKLVSECLRSSSQVRRFSGSRIDGENRCTSEAEKMILFKVLCYSGVHISELASVTFIKDYNDVLVIYLMSLIFLYKCGKLLNCSDYDFVFMRISASVPVFKLAL